MPDRYTIIERISRAVYGEQPNEDSNITFNLINQWLNEGYGVAVAANWKGSVAMDGVTYVNNSFYTTFSSLAIVPRENEKFVYQMTLPQIPMGLGKDEGIGGLEIISANGGISHDCIPLSQNQRGYFRNMRNLPNKTLYYSEGICIFLVSPLMLNEYTGRVRIISSGDSTTLDSIFNCPDDWLPMVTDYCINKLRIERAQPKDLTNDGIDLP